MITLQYYNVSAYAVCIQLMIFIMIYTVHRVTVDGKVLNIKHRV